MRVTGHGRMVGSQTVGACRDWHHTHCLHLNSNLTLASISQVSARPAIGSLFITNISPRMVSFSARSRYLHKWAKKESNGPCR